MIRVFGIDPGPKEHGWAEVCGYQLRHGDSDASDLAIKIASDTIVAIEQFTPMGQRLDYHSMDTLEQIGRIKEKLSGFRVVGVPRRFVKLYWTGRGNTTDADVWAALKARYGDPGTKLRPGFLFGVRSHQRAALALASMVESYAKGDLGELRNRIPFLDEFLEVIE